MTVTRLDPGPRMSEAVINGDTVYLAGQVPENLDGDITQQTQEVLAEIDALMARLGGSKSDLLSCQIWLTDMADFPGMNAVWDAWVDQSNPPARATCGIAALARPGMRIEIIAIARNPKT